jgi:hypothetical protein
VGVRSEIEERSIFHIETTLLSLAQIIPRRITAMSDLSKMVDGLRKPEDDFDSEHANLENLIAQLIKRDQ